MPVFDLKKRLGCGVGMLQRDKNIVGSEEIVIRA